MKKHYIFYILFVICLTTRGQNKTNTDLPCTDVEAQKAKGKWITRLDNATSVTASQKQEVYKRVDVLHNILIKMFPDLAGVDVRVNRSAGIAYFGSTRKYRFTRDGDLTYDYIKLQLIKSFSYYANFSPHYCAHTDRGIVFMPGVTNENSDGIGISVNHFSGLAGDGAPDDDWTINDLPIRMLNTMVMEKWKGYEVYGDIRLGRRQILLHREGMLPYIPVTRKQYLDRCIVVTTKMYDKIIGLTAQMAVRSPEEQEKEKNAKLAKFEKDFGKDPKRLKSAVDYYLSGYKTDQQVRDEKLANARTLKEREIKTFRDELEKTTSERLLDSPAVIRVMYLPDLIFDTDPKTGSMLVTDNPDYIRKDLPPHVPQFIVFNWKWSEYPPHKNYEKLFLQDFPIEALQAMIDK